MKNVLLLFLVAVGLFSCSTAVQREPGMTELPADFSRTGLHKLDNSHWWLYLGDKQLTGLITKALNENFTLLAAWDRLEQLQATARKMGSDRIPSLGFSAGTGRNYSYENSSSSEVDSFSLGLSTSYEIDFWGRIASRVKAAELDVQASEQELQTAALTIAANVANIWYQLIENRGLVLVSRHQQKLNSDLLEIIRVQFKSGKTGIADVLQQEQLVQSNKGELISLEAKGRILQNSLLILLGESPGSFEFDVPEEFGSLPPFPETGSVMAMINRRPDLKSAFFSLLAADARVAEAVANRYPKVSFSADVSTRETRLRDLFDDWFISLAANFFEPIVDGGSRRAEVDRTRAYSRQQLNDYRQKVLEAIGEAEEALIGEEEQFKLIDNMQVRLKLSKESVELVGERYRQGTEDYQRVLSALLSLQGLEQSMLTAKRKQFVYRVQLYGAIGGGLELKSPENDESLVR